MFGQLPRWALGPLEWAQMRGPVASSPPYRADFKPSAPKVTPVSGSNATPDLSGRAGCVTARDNAVTRAAQGVFNVPLRAAGRRFKDKGVYPRRFFRS